MASLINLLEGLCKDYNVECSATKIADAAAMLHADGVSDYETVKQFFANCIL